MTNEFRAMCAELADALAEWRLGGGPPEDTADADLIDRARALLAQPVAEVPSADEWDALVVRAWDQYETVGYQGERFMYDSDFSNALDFMRRELARFGRPTPQPEGSDIHYSWELHDAEGEWQAGGSAITLESVRREGNHYLQTYSQDGPHTLIIYQASTIEVVTND